MFTAIDLAFDGSENEFRKGTPVKIRATPFENFEGTVDRNFPRKSLVRVMVTIFSRFGAAGVGIPSG